MVLSSTEEEEAGASLGRRAQCLHHWLLVQCDHHTHKRRHVERELIYRQEHADDYGC